MEQSLSSPIRVRQAGRPDAHTIADFNARMALETEGRELDAMRLFSGTLAVFGGLEHGFYVVAERAGLVVGCLLVTKEWSDWRNGWFWWIQSVYVLPSARRTGVYRAMYRWLETQARENGPLCEGATIVGLRLYVERENESAMAAYESLGMRRAHYQLYEVDFVLPPHEGPGESPSDRRVNPSTHSQPS